MERAEGFELIRDLLSVGAKKPIVLKNLEEAGVPRATRYLWWNKYHELYSAHDAVEFCEWVMEQAKENNNPELGLKAAVAKVKCLK
jgi:hypothetical protein|tara:strand:- start:241 stop:498 length:258 start_codon:yes stop_codon:yes gene_type:complete